MTVPAWYAKWAAWRLAGAPRGKRPPNAPKTIPKWAWAKLLTETKPKPPVPLPANSTFAGKGVFTTNDPTSSFGKGADWQAYQMDPEGSPTAGWDPSSTGCYWMARPTQQMADQAARLHVPFIAQAENRAELDKALALNVHPPKALVGNPGSWGLDGKQKAAAAGWELILEWYMNDQPNYRSPDADRYPFFTNVCYGIYSEGEPGDADYVHQIPLSDYTNIWPGRSISVWKGEAMTPADWALFRIL